MLYSDYITIYKLYRSTSDKNTKINVLSIIENRFNKKWESIIDIYNQFAKNKKHELIENLGYASKEAVTRLQNFNRLFNLDDSVFTWQSITMLYTNLPKEQRQSVKNILEDNYDFTENDFSKLDELANNNLSNLLIKINPLQKNINKVYLKLTVYKENNYKLLQQGINAIANKAQIEEVKNFEETTNTIKEDIKTKLKEIQNKLELPGNGKANIETVASIYANIDKNNPVKSLLENLLIDHYSLGTKEIQRLKNIKPKNNKLIKVNFNLTQKDKEIDLSTPEKKQEQEKKESCFWWCILIAIIGTIIYKIKNNGENNNDTNRATKTRK